MKETRIERDSMGEMPVPADALYGPQTARAVENFPVSGWPMPRKFIAAMGWVKQAAAAVHCEAGRMDDELARAIMQASVDVISGKLETHFPVDVFQTGSGTSTNMNVNEVIARRASQILGGRKVHANDDVNRGQSSNDVIPTALHVSAAVAIHDNLLPALRVLKEMLDVKAEEFDGVVKIGRTHLMDAVPVRLGQEFSGYAAQIESAIVVTQQAMGSLCELPIGGTALGTGLNAPADFAQSVCLYLGEELRLPFMETPNHFAASGSRDVALQASSAMRQVALAMGKIASDIRLLGSGPRCGIGELELPAVQPGSSIMPGKVNPVICESVIQVACQVVGCDAAIAAGVTGGVGGILDLNIAMPMIAMNLITQIDLLANAARMFGEKCLAGLKANIARCGELVEKSLAMVTVLAPVIGYDQAAELAHEAMNTGKTIRELCTEKKIMPADKLAKLLDPISQTRQD